MAAIRFYDQRTNCNCETVTWEMGSASLAACAIWNYVNMLMFIWKERSYCSWHSFRFGISMQTPISHRYTTGFRCDARLFVSLFRFCFSPLKFVQVFSTCRNTQDLNANRIKAKETSETQTSRQIAKKNQRENQLSSKSANTSFASYFTICYTCAISILTIVVKYE